MKERILNIVYSALFTAVIAVVSQISLMTPLGVPVTLQIFAISLCGYILGAKWAVASVLAYILCGAVGLPVFSSFQGGIQHIFSANGGFIIGFLAVAFFCGCSLVYNSKALRIILGISGVLICHFLGVIQFKLITGVGFGAAILTASLPFILKDVFLIGMAGLTSRGINKIIKKYNRN